MRPGGTADAPASSRGTAAGEVFALLRAGFVAVVATVMLASCAYVPVAVDGVAVRPDVAAGPAPDTPWIFVPANGWITRDTVTPVSVGACAAPSCSQKVAVAVIEARGAEARTLLRSLQDPRGLATRVIEGNRRRIALVTQAQRGVPRATAARRIPLRVTARTAGFRHRDLGGFTLEMRRAAAGRSDARPAHAAVLARPRGGSVKLVLVIGERAGPVQATARAVADANL
ncbi:hypothetical protein [Phreatobacter oligotrophus]|uniref:hypothetical protein n=1 Tax=Phreatobacter oligotrophus TaxID=1122261 RepID=UPI00235512D6|nr:hypothetical protein [Phreatobacter oligotrophus]MBX9992908.1 hypothetical protein [Phreatobacter oligotrophus]